MSGPVLVRFLDITIQEVGLEVGFERKYMELSVAISMDVNREAILSIMVCTVT